MDFLSEPLRTYALLAVIVIGAFVFASLAVRLVNRLTKRISARGRVAPELVAFAGAAVRILIWFTAILFVVVNAMATLGLGDTLIGSFSSFLSANAGRIGVMVLIVIVGYVAIRILGILLIEYRRRTKLHPLTVDLFHSVAKYLIYAIVAVLLLTNILVMAGLQTLAGTLVTLFTVFIGLVVSFAATGSIGNALSGIVVMSWRPYKEGDRVEVGGGTYGDVTEVDVMFTKIKTIKNELVHVPNSQVLSNKIVNYSALGKVIVHYEVAIGYAASRKLVEDLLLQASRLTKGLTSEPEPFVLVRDLDNNYVSYEINSYTNEPNRLVTISSDLMKNTLDVFSNAGIEILSPQHVAIRESKPASALKHTYTGKSGRSRRSSA